MSAIVIRRLSKMYPVYERPLDRLKELMSRGKKRYHQEFWALRDVSFEVPRGSTVGVIGHNGSGKSTLLQVVAGVLQPTSGEVVVNGRVAALLELGAGFNPEFSGRENVYLSGAIMGIGRGEMDARFDRIAAFAEIGEFMDRPVKTYSSGMYVRLAFAVAINVDPDILLVDEALSVGDAAYQHRCMRRINELREQGKTIFFVSHDLAAVQTLCDTAVLMDHGQLLEVGPADVVVSKYIALVTAREAGFEAPLEPASSEESDEAIAFIEAEPPEGNEPQGVFRHGQGQARIRRIEVLNRQGHATSIVDFGEEVTIRIRVEFLAPLEAPILGMILRDRFGIDLVAANTKEDGQPIGPRSKGERIVVDFKQKLPLKPGTYSINPALAVSEVPLVFADWIDNALVFQVAPPRSGKTIHGLVDLLSQVTVRTINPKTSTHGGAQK